MCGICGVATRDASAVVETQTLLAMRDSMERRGPDDAGHYIAPGVALGSRRLAIIDLSNRGHMPMSTEDGRYHIVYNGEIYNFRELRAWLESRGRRFRSNTDTEVLLALFVEQGPQMLERLNGMFAFAVWDSQEQNLFLTRDRLGVKPLYYTVSNENLYFGSEEKSLFAAGVPAEFDQERLGELLCFRSTAGEHTPFKNIKRLAPGHSLTWRRGDIRITRWWNLAEKIRHGSAERGDDLFEWFPRTFDDAVDLRRISDVPVGVLLSGGLDSASVAASLAGQSGSRVSTFTVRFEQPEYDEGPLAKELAARWNLDYHELSIAAEELMARVEDASWFNDEPLAHGNDPYLLAISAYAKSKVTVLLSGEGADETLGGYVRYQPLHHPALLKSIRAALPVASPLLQWNYRTRKLSRFLSLGSIDRFVLYNSCDVLPPELKSLYPAMQGEFPARERILAEAQSLYPAEPLRQVMYYDLNTFLCSLLDRNDRMTMGASIECRVPFLDYRLVEKLCAAPTASFISRSTSKHLLRNSLGDRLPDSIRTGRKWGFGVPWHRYFREIPVFRDLVEKLPSQDPIRDAPFERSRLKSLITEFLAGEDRHAPIIRQLVMIAVWRRSYFERLKGRKVRTAEAAQAR
jgi:asparagine synthase (glutamine-hydrolysing)